MGESEDRKKEKPVKFENVAEETGELIGKGLRKTWGIAKSFGKGLADTLENGDKRKDAASLACPHCSSSLSPNSNFCPHCGKEH